MEETITIDDEIKKNERKVERMGTKVSDSLIPVLSEEQCLPQRQIEGLSIKKCFTASENQDSCKCDTVTLHEVETAFIITVCCHFEKNLSCSVT